MNTKPWNKVLEAHYELLSRPAPCDNCSHRQKCRDQLLACGVFSSYVKHNQYRKKERAPTRKIWHDIFSYDENEYKGTL
jgi:hypothetical protein